MNIYSQQLIAEICEHLDVEIIAFFENTKDKYNYQVNSIIELVKYTMEENLDGKTAREDLRKIYDGLIRNRRKRKIRWLEKVEQDANMLQSTSPAHSFHDLLIQKQILKKDQWEQIYGNATLDEIISRTLEEARSWQKNPCSYLISFPNIERMTPNKIFDSLVSDTLFCLFQYINNEYDGAIKNYFLTLLPSALLGIPLFAPKRTRLNPSETDGSTLIDNYEYQGENESSFILKTSTELTAMDADNPLFVMDRHDLMFLLMALQNLDVDFYSTRQARIKKASLARVLYSRPGKKHYDMLDEHLLRMTKYNFTIVTNGKKGMRFNLIDTVDIRDPEEVVFTFGNVLYTNIINSELTNVKSSTLRRLDKNISSILFHPLFKARMLLSIKCDSAEDVSDNYSYSFFARNVRFPNQNKKKNMDIIEESLKEFVHKKIIVKSYEREKASSGFRITFYPLSEEERADLSYKKFKNLLTDDEFKEWSGQ